MAKANTIRALLTILFLFFRRQLHYVVNNFLLSIYRILAFLYSILYPYNFLLFLIFNVNEMAQNYFFLILYKYHLHKNQSILTEPLNFHKYGLHHLHLTKLRKYLFLFK